MAVLPLVTIPPPGAEGYRFEYKSVWVKARKALKPARPSAKSDDWGTFNAVFGIDGLVHELFKTPSERTAFSETQ